jgi:hypothetical protein
MGFSMCSTCSTSMFLILLAVILQYACTEETTPDTSALTSVVEGLINHTEAGERHHFHLQARDAYGQPIQSGGNIWSVRFVGPVYVSSTCIKDEGTGQYEITYTLPQPGTYRIEIELMYHRITVPTAELKCSPQKIFEMYKKCNPVSSYYMIVDKLRGCQNLSSTECLGSTKAYAACMDHAKEVCQLPRLVKEPLLHANQLYIQVHGQGVLSPHTARPCASRSEVLGPGHWVDVRHACTSWQQLHFHSFTACRDAVFSCSTKTDRLSRIICQHPLQWRPNTCTLAGVSNRMLAAQNRQFVLHGVSTTQEIARRMMEYYGPRTTITIHTKTDINLTNHAYYDNKNTTFVLAACGQSIATKLTLDLFDAAQLQSCHNFLKKFRSVLNHVDLVYHRHPVNYPRHMHSAEALKSAIGRYPGSRGYMSVNELLTDFYYEVMDAYMHEKVNIDGILDQQSMTEALWPRFGDGLHYDNKQLTFVVDSACLVLANMALLPHDKDSPSGHDPNIGTCHSSIHHSV